MAEATTSSMAPSTAAPEHPPVIDLSDFETRKNAIAKEMMDAATTVGVRQTCTGDA